MAWKNAKKSGPGLYLWRRAAGLNRPTFAKLANFSERSLATYESRKQLPKTIRPQVNEAARLVEALLELVPGDSLTGWLRTPNPGFGGHTPWALIMRGERDIIWAMIHQTRQGAFA